MSSKKILTAHKGRKCKHPDCKRLLSIYNHSVNCHVHLNQMSDKTRWEECEGIVKKISHL